MWRGEEHQPHDLAVAESQVLSQTEKSLLQPMFGQGELGTWLHYNLVWQNLSPSSLDADILSWW